MTGKSLCQKQGIDLLCVRVKKQRADRMQGLAVRPQGSSPVARFLQWGLPCTISQPCNILRPVRSCVLQHMSASETSAFNHIRSYWKWMTYEVLQHSSGFGENPSSKTLCSPVPGPIVVPGAHMKWENINMSSLLRKRKTAPKIEVR